MKKHISELLNETNDTRLKKYFNLKELESITGMSPRALKYRMKEVKKIYENIPALLEKSNRQWKIHYTIVKEFEPKYRLKSKTVYTYDWLSLATWNPMDNYNAECQLEFIKQIKRQLPENTISYVVEVDGRNFHHTHLISDAEPHRLNKAITATLHKYLNPKDVKIQVEPIYNKYSAVEYLKKAAVIKGLLL